MTRLKSATVTRACWAFTRTAKAVTTTLRLRTSCLSSRSAIRPRRTPRFSLSRILPTTRSFRSWTLSASPRKSMKTRVSSIGQTCSRIFQLVMRRCSTEGPRNGQVSSRQAHGETSQAKHGQRHAQPRIADGYFHHSRLLSAGQFLGCADVAECQGYEAARVCRREKTGGDRHDPDRQNGDPGPGDARREY